MTDISYRGHRFPPIVIQHAVWLYLRFTLSYRDVEELLAERGLDLSHETVRSWVRSYGAALQHLGFPATMSRDCDRTIGPKTATKRYGGASARCSALNQLDRLSDSSVFTLPPTTISTFNATWSLDRPFGSSGQKQPRNGAVQRHDPRHNQTTITADAAQLDKACTRYPGSRIAIVAENTAAFPAPRCRRSAVRHPK